MIPEKPRHPPSHPAVAHIHPSLGPVAEGGDHLPDELFVCTVDDLRIPVDVAEDDLTAGLQNPAYLRKESVLIFNALKEAAGPDDIKTFVFKRQTGFNVFVDK